MAKLIWIAEKCAADGLVTYDVTLASESKGRKRRLVRGLLECRSMADAKRIAGLLNETQAGIDINYDPRFPWQNALLKERAKTNKLMGDTSSLKF